MRNNQKEKMLVALLNAFAQADDLSYEEKFDAINDIHNDLKKINTIERLPSEIFVLVPGTLRFYASNKGRILKITSQGEALCRFTRSKNKTGRYYYDVGIDFGNGRKKCRVSRVIAKTWLDDTLPIFYSESDDRRVVDHITEDTLDNSLKNIRIIDQSSNIRRSIYESGKNVGKKCKRCFAEKDGVRTEYASTGDLVRAINGNSNSGPFENAIRKNYKLKGYTVGYLD